MTGNQVKYAKRLQEKLSRLNPIREKHVSLLKLNINYDTNPRIIDELLEAIRFEEYMEDLAFSGNFEQD